jgi:AcrR family transcriptional regulator
MTSRTANSEQADSVRTGRVPKEERRRQLLRVAAEILTAQGIEYVQITEVAERAGVSRPLVYRLFPTRRALVEALLEDFSSQLSTRFSQALVSSLPGSLPQITEAFVKASCDAIEAHGVGPWLLLDARGTDPELGRLGRTILAQLLKPWQKQLAELTGLPPRRAVNLMWVVVAAGRAALDGWIEGAVSRRAAIEDATRAVTSLLQAFARPL